MSSLELYVMRHGESEANAKHVIAGKELNPNLTPQGIAQIEEQAKSLAGVNFAHAYVSPLQRTRQTAAIVNKCCDFEMTIVDQIREVNFGALEAQCYIEPEIHEQLHDLFAAWGRGDFDAHISGGESFTDVVARLDDFLRIVQEEQQNAAGPILVVGHGVMFLVFFWQYCRNRNPEIMENYFGRGHYSILEGNSEGFDIVKFNIAPN